MTADEKPHQVVSRDILHRQSADGDEVAVAVGKLGAGQPIAPTAIADAQRSGRIVQNQLRQRGLRIAIVRQPLRHRPDRREHFLNRSERDIRRDDDGHVRRVWLDRARRNMRHPLRPGVEDGVGALRHG